jgi:hypothetical protein
VVVLQAAAGEQLAGRSPEAVAQALDDIGRVARQAPEEIGALVTLLTREDDDRTPLADLTHRLVAAAAATGLDVTCRVAGPTRVPPGATSHAAHRVIQEGVTNALRHAPGAPVRISVREDAGNCSPRSTRPVPGDPAGGYGLAGMRDRVARCRGTLDAEPLPGGGWRVHARLPLPWGRAPTRCARIGATALAYPAGTRRPLRAMSASKIAAAGLKVLGPGRPVRWRRRCSQPPPPAPTWSLFPRLGCAADAVTGAGAGSLRRRAEIAR